MPRLTISNLLGVDLGVANSSTGFARGFTIPVAGLTLDITGGDLEQLAPQLDAHRVAGRISWTQAQNPNVSDAMEVLSGAGRVTLLPTVQTAAKGAATAVHAAIAGNTAVDAVTTGITNPGVPRNLIVTIAASWDGGVVSVSGTDQFDLPITETFGSVAATVVGSKAFKTVTSMSHSVLGATANTYSVGLGDKIGVPYRIANSAGLCFVGATTLASSVIEAVVIDPVYSTYASTTVPDGAKFITVFVNTVG